MRVAMVGTRGLPALAGGAEHVVEELARELTSLGHEVIVYSRKNYVAGESAPTFARRIITPGFGGKHLDAFTHTATAMLDLLGRSVDLVHVHSPGPALMSWLPALAGIPVVFTIHAPDWKRAKWSAPARIFIKSGLRMGLSAASAVTCVSEPLARELSLRYSREITYIPNAVRPRESTDTELEKWGLCRDGYALNVARIEKEKCLDLLLSAWNELNADIPLVVVGDWRKNSFGRRCKVLAGNNVIFPGAVYGEKLAQLYLNARVVVLPSVLEGMSLVLLEAASHSRCILAADIDANRAVMGDSILYYKQSDFADLKLQMVRAIADSSIRSRMGESARRAARRYEWSTVARQYERAYLKVVQSQVRI